MVIHTFVQYCVTTVLKDGLGIVHLDRAVRGRTVNTILFSGGM